MCEEMSNEGLSHHLERPDIFGCGFDPRVARGRHYERFNDDSLFYRAWKPADFGVTTFICGAISSFYGALVEGYRIRLIPFVHGQVDEVLDAFLNNSLVNPRFVMRGYLPDAMREGS
jgi:hypothetical protein